MSDANDQVAHGRAVLRLLLAVQRQLAAGRQPAEIPAALGVRPHLVTWALDVLSVGPPR